MIVEKLDLYLTGSDKRIDEKILKEMYEAFRFSVIRQLMENRELSSNLRGSNPGPCARKMAYKFLGYEPTRELDARAHMTFLMGDLIELVSVGIMKLAGVNVVSTCLDDEGQAEGFFEVGNGELVGCHPDGILLPQTGVTDDKRLLEVKSTSAYGFRDFSRGNIGDQYRLQHQVYMETFGLDKGIFFVVNKNTGHYCEVLTEKDPEYVEWARKNYLLASEASKDGLPPRFMDFENYGRKKEKDGSWSEKLCWGCGYCDFNRYCWPGIEVDFDRSRPIYKAPLDPEDDTEWVTTLGKKMEELLQLDLGVDNGD